MDSVNQPTVSQTEPALPPQANLSQEVLASTGVAPALDPVSSEPQAAALSARKVTVSFGSDLISSLQSLMGTVVIAIFVITFIVQAFQIPSESMENTLLVGDYLLVNKLCYGGTGLGDHVMPYQKIGRGDIIVFHYPVDPKQHFVKRVVGLPGDRLRMVKKRVLINGKPLEEPYVHLEPGNDPYRDDFPRTDILVANRPDITAANKEESKKEPKKEPWSLQMRKLVEDGELIIPQGNYFVMGDNRDNSDDSRYWGFVPQENIIGRPLLIYWSVRDWDESPASTIAGRLRHLAYAATHLFRITRWNRTLRLVH
jgi:signal peptidase I